MNPILSRRSLLASAVATGLAVPLAARPGSAAPARTPSPGEGGPARITLPGPTGPHRVGTAELHLVDKSRPDPETGGRRELMASVWYPAGRGAGRHPVADWMPAAGWHELLAWVGLAAEVAPPRTAGHLGAPVARGRDRRPVVLYSHGNDSCRAETTIVVQELASHGYVVVTVDHTYDGVSQFPDGRVTLPTAESFTPWDSAADVLVALDALDDIAAGRNPDADGRPLPAGLGAALDLRRIGMFGWSKGATSTALVMNVDRRVRAGLGFDGEMQAQPPVAGLDRPFMLMTAEHGRDAEPSVAEFWSMLRGWRLEVRADGAAHGSYNDQQWLVPQLAELVGLGGEDLADWVGTLDPGRAVRIQRAYPKAFFDLHLRGRGHLLDGPSRHFPEVRFLPRA
ncbi:putative dienelactone hydrolase [Actinoplanes octamycinicus]|uniref:Putative dienelactone hydrolase n=1 Tax=Actinoplanes octamycinicus TaxID=135948 RepID=A0A7W7H496_9ACTN|nr:acetylhydrolase [Actinoplanes octamycinicus]MBB4743549.1 putative dienelactone hydrolase [Actinoplanes octamycinicus]GIE62463.1 lipase [Actinoplanes octamycinicus]